MYKVLQPFFDGATYKSYFAGLEIADDPALAWAESRGLIEKIEEKKPEAKAVEKKKAPAKKATTTKKSTKK